jgi:hypothetical protein
MRIRLATGIAAIAGLALLPPGAMASVEVGSTCAADGFAPDFTVLQLEKAGADGLPLAVPKAGVVTRWRVDSGLGSLMAENLRVFRSSGEPGAFRTIADSRREAILPGENVFSARIPVRAGDRLGAFGASPSGALYCSSANPGDVMGAVHFDTGTEGAQAFTSNPGFEVALSATVEPDADHDGYGDETQDRCPHGRAFHRACPRVRMRAVAKERRSSILLFVTVSSVASVHAYGQVGLGRGRDGSRIVGLDGGTGRVGTGRTRRFRLPLPSSVLRRLDRLAPSRSLTARLTAASTDLAGRVKTRDLRVELPGRAGAG